MEYFGNETFALKVGLALSELKDDVLDDDLIWHYLYALKFRHISEDGWLLWFDPVFSTNSKKHAKGKK